MDKPLRARLQPRGAGRATSQASLFPQYRTELVRPSRRGLTQDCRSELARDCACHRAANDMNRKQTCSYNIARSFARLRSQGEFVGASLLRDSPLPPQPHPVRRWRAESRAMVPRLGAPAKLYGLWVRRPGLFDRTVVRCDISRCQSGSLRDS